MKNTSEQLTASFHELYLIEQKARDYYAQILSGNVSSIEHDIIQGIHDDESRHMEIVQDILKIIEAKS